MPRGRRKVVRALVVMAVLSPASVSCAGFPGATEAGLPAGQHQTPHESTRSSRQQITRQDDPAHPRGASAVAGFLVWTRYDDAITFTARLVRSDSDGHSAIPITHPPSGAADLNPRVSPDGRRVLFERSANGRAVVMVVHANGSGERPINLRCTHPCVGTTAAVWTPDGQSVVFVRETASGRAGGGSSLLWKATIDGGHQIRLSAPGVESRYSETGVAFTPRGSLLITRTQPDGRSALFGADADASNARQLTPWTLAVGRADVSRFAGTGGRETIVFESSGLSRADAAAERSVIATVPADCTSVRDCLLDLRVLTPVTAERAAYFNPAWSPDGSRIVFTRSVARGAQTTGDIWTMAADGSGRTPVSRDWRFELRPDWGGEAVVASGSPVR